MLDIAKLVLLVDGYNIIAPVAPPGVGGDVRWLERERSVLLKRLGGALPESVRRLTCIVFDAANPPANISDQYRCFGMNVRFAIGYPEADDLIEELILACSAPKRLAVISSDHRIQAAAKRRSSVFFDSEVWFDELMSGGLRLAPGVMSKLEEGGAGEGTEEKCVDSPSLTQEEVEQWLKDFDY